MHTDIVDLRAFYASPLGQMAQRSIAMSLSRLWQPIANERLMGLGYTTPYLDQFGTDTERVMAFMPAGQGAVRWPKNKPNATALVFDEDLPLPDSALDRILMVHALEHSENPFETLNEMWRVLSPSGRIVIVVPNRRGLWARFEHTPFGTGRPFSSGQLGDLLKSAQFSSLAWSDALHFPPWDRQRLFQMFRATERLGRRMWPVFSGVTVVEAKKLLYQGTAIRERQSRRVFVPVLSPQGAASVVKAEEISG
ncbi:MAG: methyltransferase domain-containing protein [Pseudomonadota bacterium]